MFGADLMLREQVREIATEQGIRIAAIIDVLVQKGVVTTDELERSILICQAAFDQEIAAHRDNA